MSAHAETLVSILRYLDSVERQIGSMLRRNREQLRRADAYIADSFSQMAMTERDPAAVIREDMFLPE